MLILKHASIRIADNHFLVTAGPTYEALDPIRFLGNHSSGKMGFAIAEALAEKGAEVTLITGPSNCRTFHPQITVYRITEAKEMYKACTEAFPNADAAILAAAVADYRPKYRQDKKIKKKDQEPFYLELEQTPDILSELGKMKQEGQLLIGFSLETDNPLANAKAKLRNKRLDLIVLNHLDPKAPHFGESLMDVKLIRDDETIETLNAQSKEAIALEVVDEIQQTHRS